VVEPPLLLGVEQPGDRTPVREKNSRRVDQPTTRGFSFTPPGSPYDVSVMKNRLKAGWEPDVETTSTVASRQRQRSRARRRSNGIAVRSDPRKNTIVDGSGTATT
jgi:hypothetical protein